MPQSIPTVDNILTWTHIGRHYHDLPVEDGYIRVYRRDLLPILKATYDPTNPHWFHEIDFDSGHPELPYQELR